LTPEWDGVNQFNSPMLDIVPGVTNLLHNRGIMTHSILAAAVYVAMVLTPCAIALLSAARHSTETK
jgi:hypothetical protein